MKGHYIGIMSGTSMDGIDGILGWFDDAGQRRMLASASVDIPASLRKRLLALNTSGPDELARAAVAGNELADLYADVVAELLQTSRLGVQDVLAVGVHGQTVRHCPEHGFTVQLNSPARLAERCGIDVIADFRSRDIAAGGQGAPLAPAFHAALFAGSHARAIVNLGGIANVTVLRSDGPVIGFDTGPANVLMDLWCEINTGASYDDQGQWAATGQAYQDLLEFLLEHEPFFTQPAPKSTGRDLFNEQWLRTRLQQFGRAVPPQDVQATLRQLTVRTVASAIQANAPRTADVFVCGGGARNAGLLQQLSLALDKPVQPTDALGVPAQWLEAMGFAWLAYAHCTGLPVDLCAATGASGPRRLGARYPA